MVCQDIPYYPLHSWSLTSCVCEPLLCNIVYFYNDFDHKVMRLVPIQIHFEFAPPILYYRITIRRSYLPKFTNGSWRVIILFLPFVEILYCPFTSCSIQRISLRNLTTSEINRLSLSNFSAIFSMLSWSFTSLNKTNFASSRPESVLISNSRLSSIVGIYRLSHHYYDIQSTSPNHMNIMHTLKVTYLELRINLFYHLLFQPC